MLLRHGASSNDLCAAHAFRGFSSPMNEFSPLGAAISANQAQIVKILLDNGADPNLSCFNNKWSPLEFAISKVSCRIAKEPRSADDDAQIRIIEALLHHGASLEDSCCSEEYTLFGFAVGKGHENLVQVFLEYCEIDFSAPCFRQYTPLQLAQAYEYPKIVEQLMIKTTS